MYTIIRIELLFLLTNNDNYHIIFDVTGKNDV